MLIQGQNVLRDFSKEYANARKPLNRWAFWTERATWRTPHDIRKVFNDVSFVGETTIFNIGGNKFRLLSHVLFEKQIVAVYSILTHVEYDRLTIK